MTRCVLERSVFLAEYGVGVGQAESIAFMNHNLKLGINRIEPGQQRVLAFLPALLSLMVFHMALNKWL